jgi:UDP-N-acetylmuramate--alanine ligase
LNKACDYSAQNINFNNGMPSYELYHHGDNLGVINLNIPGEHNVLNSLAAIACAHTLGVNIKVAQKTLAEFTGTQRRFDVHGITDKGVTIIDDYAHHPTEIKASLKAAKTLNHNKLWCIFQSHTYTRTIALFDEFAESFENADNIIITEIYAAREINIHKISASSLAERIKENYPDKHVIFIEKLEDVADYIKENASSNDIVMTMGAGDVFKICGMLLN